VICGIMGTLVVVNRIVFLSGGIAHAAYGGIGLAFFSAGRCWRAPSGSPWRPPC
jgi:ABC-type Mn2+/Zn2+ transport system permease subunit